MELCGSVVAITGGSKGFGLAMARPGSAWTTFSEGWNEAALRAGLEAWHNSGPQMDTGMEVEQVAHAVGYCLEQPAGTAVDLLEVRPNRPAPKLRP